ncbi:hypothetical protein [Corynebacterium kalidii]|uniref:Uncharacterized protein n=1 Tax=Corynebacterium kalidii TaxID=2931982 RepID=A0A9X1WFP1_9CORY|nr:hypothetical protein [Corynebacterium kalidii]MCJ7857583.1 hypothetical protein [Corynebacterium kalidii]
MKRFLPLAGLLAVLFLVAVLGTALADNGAPPEVDSEPARATSQETTGDGERDAASSTSSTSPTSATSSSSPTSPTSPGKRPDDVPPAPGTGAVPAEPGAGTPRDLPLNYSPYAPGGTGTGTGWDDDWDDDGDDDWDDDWDD